MRPDGFGLVRVEAHCHDERTLGVVLPVAHRIPDELARTGPAEVADIFGLEVPGTHGGGARLLVLRGFLRCDDEHRRLCRFRLLKTRTLLHGKHLLGILQYTCRGNDVVRRYGQFHIVVAELQREFAAPEELFVLPARVVRIGGQAREPLRQEEQVGVVGLEVLVAATRTDRRFVHDIEGEIDRQLQRLAGLQRGIEVDAQHGVVQLRVQHLAAGGGHRA